MLKELTIIRIMLSVLMLAFSLFTHAQSTDIEYLPANQNYNPKIPLPADVLGYPVGTWHVRHDQLLTYLEVLADHSERISLVKTGHTHEQRALVLLTVTAPKNHNNVARLTSEHLARLQHGEKAPSDSPLIIYMGYSVHGNEPSGSNASLLVAYHLAASNSPEVLELLNENIVLIDPSMNPDGLARFAQWANMHKGKNLVSDPMHREHREHWPSGRTNHYWFDLNRDWLLLTHPESQARIGQFHAWRPHILTDFHEMGTNSTFFFQPGVASRKNPWTPEENVTITGNIGQFHASALDADKQLYFTEESFDDFYYGKGSTYPDAHGSIGILFEQASSRGHVQESINGLLTFQKSIQNQVTTSLSTFAGALANKSAILAYQESFFKDTQSLIKEDKVSGFLIAGGKDRSRFSRMVEILKGHKIDVQLLTKSITLDSQKFSANNSVFVSLNQPQYRLLKSLFSERQRFTDNTFYDVSNWNIALAFNLPYQAITSSTSRKLSLNEWTVPEQVESVLQADAYAFAFEWFDHQAPTLLQHLLKHEVQARIAGGGFTAKTSDGEFNFGKGTVVIPAALVQPNNIVEILKAQAKTLNIKVHNITSGLTSKGLDLGSRRFAKVDKPEVLLVGGMGTSSYEIGEMWHYLDTRLGLAATIWDLQDLSIRDLDRYSHIMFASGGYSSMNDRVVKKIDQWVKDGGVLIGQKSAVSWFSANGWISNKILSNEGRDAVFSTTGLQFADRQSLGAKKLVAGAVYESKIDLTHPLFYGYERSSLPVFKTSNMVLNGSNNPFEDIGMYTDEPLIAGYSADEMQELIKNTASIVAVKKGKGVVIAFVDNMHFRGYWDGTNKLTANALFMSALL